MFKKMLSFFVVICFIFNSIISPTISHADIVAMPIPGTMVNLSPAYEPVIIKGLTVHQDNPFLFDFIVDVGQDKASGEALKNEGEKLIKYFLASITVPEKDLWVNLSPYEKDRMVPEALGKTALGRDLLAQDYILKQLTASLIYPEKDLGKKFWDKVYSKAQAMYGTSQVPVNTFNKVWIVADRAEVFERNQTAFVVKQHLKVLLEADYLAAQKNAVILKLEGMKDLNKDSSSLRNVSQNDSKSINSQIIREIILPELEHEVNTGKNFANLRQMFNSIILASWYKKNLKEAVLNQVYANQGKVKGIDLKDPRIKEQIYQQYLQAYKKGVFNYIKEDVINGQTMPKKYFSGGMNPGKALDPSMSLDTALLASSIPSDRALVAFNTGLNTRSPDSAMVGDVNIAPSEERVDKVIAAWGELNNGFSSSDFSIFKMYMLGDSSTRNKAYEKALSLFLQITTPKATRDPSEAELMVRNPKLFKEKFPERAKEIEATGTDLEVAMEILRMKLKSILILLRIIAKYNQEDINQERLRSIFSSTDLSKGDFKKSFEVWIKQLGYTLNDAKLIEQEARTLLNESSSSSSTSNDQSARAPQFRIERGLFKGLPDAIKALKGKDLTGVRVLLRVNQNIPLNKQGQIDALTDLTRLEESLPILRFLLGQHADVILIGHHGRGDDSKSLEPTVKFFQNALPDVSVKFYPDSINNKKGLNIIAQDLTKDTSKSSTGSLHILENVRLASDFEQALSDSDNRREFAQRLANLADIFVLDAYADLGSKGASIEDLPAVFIQQGKAIFVGPAMVREADKLSSVVEDGVDAVIMGGVKPDKVDPVVRIAKKTLKHQGFILLGSAPSSKLPVDHELRKDDRVLTAQDYSSKEAFDIGPETINLFKAKLDSLKSGKNVIVNGTMGWVEEGNTQGTKEIFEKLKTLAERGVNVIFIGGDSSANARTYGLEGVANVSLITGGGVVLKIAAGENLVGVEAMKNAMEIRDNSTSDAAMKALEIITQYLNLVNQDKEGLVPDWAKDFQKIGEWSEVLATMNMPDPDKKVIIEGIFKLVREMGRSGSRFEINLGKFLKESGKFTDIIDAINNFLANINSDLRINYSKKHPTFVPKQRMKKVLEQSLEDVRVDFRGTNSKLAPQHSNIFKRNSIKTIGELVQKSRAELRKLGVGESGLSDIDKILLERNLMLGGYALRKIKPGKEGNLKETLDQPLTKTGLSIRAINVLKKNGIATVRDLVKLTKIQLSHYIAWGTKTWWEIDKKLEELGFYYGSYALQRIDFSYQDSDAAMSADFGLLPNDDGTDPWNRWWEEKGEFERWKENFIKDVNLRNILDALKVGESSSNNKSYQWYTELIKLGQEWVGITTKITKMGDKGASNELSEELAELKKNIRQVIENAKLDLNIKLVFNEKMATWSLEPISQNPVKLTRLEDISDPFKFSVFIKNPRQIHGGPGTLISVVASFFESIGNINVSKDGQTADALSQIQLMLLGINKNSKELIFEMSGIKNKLEALQMAVALKILIEDIQFFEGNKNHGYTGKDDLKAKVINMSLEELLERFNSDTAMVGDKALIGNNMQTNAFPGGIDLNTSSGMDWKISKDGKGVQMRVDPAMIDRIKREGIESLSPVIFKITPIVSIWPLIGMEDPKVLVLKV